MIRYSLRCENGHTFESWFQNSDAFASQHKRKLVSCPACDSIKVEKAIMAPQLSRKSNSRAQPDAAPIPADQQPMPLAMAPQERELMAKLREIRDHVTKTAENVGEKFPDEARKMHYGDIDHRPIFGEATSDEAQSLIEEGIDVLPLPVLPDDRN